MPRKKRPVEKPTHPQTANGRFSWQVEYGRDPLNLNLVRNVNMKQIWFNDKSLGVGQDSSVKIYMPRSVGLQNKFNQNKPKIMSCHDIYIDKVQIQVADT